MKVAIYHPWIHLKGGGERILLELLKKSRHDITLFTSHYRQENTYEDFKKFKIIQLTRLPIIGELFRGLSFGLHLILCKLDLSPFDAFVVSSAGIGELITIRNHSKPALCICLTPLRAAHDTAIYRHKLKEKNPISRQIYRLSIFFYKLLEKAAWKHFSSAICISKNVRRRVLDGQLIGNKNITVSYPGADFLKKGIDGEFRNYFLYPSRFAYYKRHELAIDAFKLFKARDSGNFKLILAGGLSGRNRKHFNFIESLAKGNDNIEIRTNVSDKEMKALYESCYCVLFCGMNEDWGMIPVEAGLYKKPVISVAEGGPLESIIDGRTGFLVPARPRPFAAAMEKIARDVSLAKKMGGENFHNVKRFDWKKFVGDFDREVEKIAKRNKAA
ncbi:MAG: glycosyltransferase [Candidatus Aenigmarchaeota archaeon]|nr:glycosyltransferase [Candidatus Aenigmarchaeota archaeon]